MVYLITWTTYGSRLHGDPRGTVDRHHRAIGGPAVEPSLRREAYEFGLLIEPEFRLTGPAPQVVRDALVATCRHRSWNLIAAHVRCNHVHAVVAAAAPASAVLNALKANATRELKAAGLMRTRFWTRGGSTRCLTQRDSVVNAVNYVVHGQGDPVAVWLAADWLP